MPKNGYTHSSTSPSFENILLCPYLHFHFSYSTGEDHSAEDQTETLVEFVDMVMKDQDLNDDGFIDYPEYINYYTKFDKVDDAPPASQP